MATEPNFVPYGQDQSNMKSTVIQFNDPPPNTASLFSPNTNATLSSLPLQELIDFHKNRLRKTMKYVYIVFGVMGLIGLILMIVSFTLPKCQTELNCNNTNLVLLVLGITFLATGVLFILILVLVVFCQMGRQFTDVTDATITQQPIIWRLDGAEWTRYLDYIHGPDRQWTQLAPLSSFCCRQSSYTRLLNRQYGHIVLYWNGLIIDELHFVSFRQFELQYIELMNFDPQQRIQGLRIHTYMKAGKNSRDCYFDVFAPSYVSLEQLQFIIQSYTGIMSDSAGARLATLGLRLFT